MRSCRFPTLGAALVATVAIVGVTTEALAQHRDVLAQVVEGQIVTGAADYDNNTWTLGERVFRRQFLSNFRTNDPGFTTLETGDPLLGGAATGFLPQEDIFFDIVTTQIDGVHANFWYWDGLDDGGDGYTADDVAFGAAPTGITWNIFEDNDVGGGALFTADGSDTHVSGGLIQRTFSSTALTAGGGMHNHLRIQVDDGDGNSTTKPPEGLYLAAVEIRAAGYETSDPVILVHRSSTLTNEARDIAYLWASDNYESLAGLTDAIAGDFNADGRVDNGDLNLLLGSWGEATVPGEWTSGFVAPVDNGELNDLLGGWGTGVPAAAVPEPAALVVAWLVLAAAMSRRG